MNNKFETITTFAQDYMRILREMSFVVQEYKREICNGIESIRTNDETSKNIINDLFRMQEELSIIKYKFNYEFDDFINGFIYEFDRQDSESVNYLINKIRQDKNFLFDDGK